jgi:hypothetical protein
MSWFTLYQYASLKNCNKPLLRGVAFPVVAWEISNDNLHVLAVKLKMSDSSHDFRWFTIGEVDLFKSCKEYTLLFSGDLSPTLFDKLLKKLHLSRG